MIMRRLAVLALAFATAIAGCGGRPAKCIVLEGATGSPEAAFRDYLVAINGQDAEKTWALMSTKFQNLMVLGMRVLGKMPPARQSEGAAQLGLTVAEVRSLPPETLARMVISRGFLRHPDVRECVTAVSRDAHGVITIHTRATDGDHNLFVMVLEPGGWRVDPLLEI